jgi:hypothetical protein
MPGERERPVVNPLPRAAGEFSSCGVNDSFSKSSRVSNLVQTPFFHEDNLRRQGHHFEVGWRWDPHEHLWLLPRLHRLLDACH